MFFVPPPALFFPSPLSLSVMAKRRRGMCDGLASGATPVESEPCVSFNGADILKAELVKVTKVVRRHSDMGDILWRKWIQRFGPPCASGTSASTDPGSVDVSVLFSFLEYVEGVRIEQLGCNESLALVGNDQRDICVRHFQRELDSVSKAVIYETEDAFRGSACSVGVAEFAYWISPLPVVSSIPLQVLQVHGGIPTVIYFSTPSMLCWSSCIIVISII
jgi:hypothetical protein